MAKDVYEIWEPLGDIPSNLVFFKLDNDFKGITIILKELGSEETILKIVFDGVLSYRVTQETGRTTFFKEYPITNFMKSKDSEFLRWFYRESGEFFGEWDLTHFLIVTEDNVIDVISGPPSTFKLFNVSE